MGELERNPLLIINEWFDGMAESTQEELVSLAAHFHPEEEIEFLGSRQEKVKYFLKWINPTGLSNKQVLLRSLAATRLIEFVLESRGTEASWTETMDLHLACRSRAVEQGHSTDVHDSFLDNFQERKSVWLETNNSWEVLRSTTISDRKLADWYFFAY